MFGRLARLVITHPWQVIGLWALGAIVAIVLSPSLNGSVTSNQQAFLPKSFESVHAQNVGNQYFPTQSGATGSLVVSRHDGGTLTSADQSKVSGLASSLQNDKIPGVVAVRTTPQSLSPNGKVEALQVAFNGQPGNTQVNSAVTSVRSKSSSYLAGSGLKSGLTGNAAIQLDTSNAYSHADAIITVATLIAIVVLLGLIFRSPIIAILPILVIGIVHGVVTGLTADLAKAFGFQVGSTLPSLLVVVLFGIGTDYIVFLLFRYRERLRRGLAPKDALVSAYSAVGKVVASSALTVIGAFAALLLAKLGSLNTLAPGLIVAVAAMLVTALTLVPAIFALLGRNLFWPVGPGTPSRRNVFGREGALVSRRAPFVAGGIGIVLVGLTIASFGYKATYNTLAELPSSTPSQQAYNTMATGFPSGALSPTQVYVVGNAKLTSASLNTLNANLTKTPGVASIAPPQFSSDSKVALVNVVLKDDPYSNAALDLVAGPVRSAAHGSVPGEEVLVGGQSATLADVRYQLHSDTRLVFPVAGVIIAVILALLLQALLAPLTLLVCVGLTFAATLGAGVLVFLHGLGYSGIDFSIPIVLYLFVVAIGTDYNILMSSRLREEFLNGYRPAEAAKVAITNDAPTVAAAGMILALTFASLMLTGIANLVELGFGVAVGVVIAAFGMGPLLVSSLSVLEKGAFWWPRHRPRASAIPADEVRAGRASGRAGQSVGGEPISAPIRS